MTDIGKIVSRVRDASICGIPLTLIADISALCDAVDGAIPALELLQARLEAGCRIKHDGAFWCLFDASGALVTRGESIRAMVINLIFVDS